MRTREETDEATCEPRLVVGVGASAGGLDAFKRLLTVLNDASTMAFVFVQHLDAEHESRLVELLSRCSPMRVVRAEDGAALHSGVVHVIGPGTVARVRSGRLEVERSTRSHGPRTVIDDLFRSLSEDCSPRVAGVLLTGAGGDGASGLRDLRAAGGLTIAQDPETAAQPGMPQSAIRVSAAELVLPIEAIPEALERFAALPSEAVEPVDAALLLDDRVARATRLSSRELDRLAEVLGARADFDVVQYKAGTVERRVLRRMGLGGFESLDDYLDQLRRDESERQALARDLLIHVTRFFRDFEACEALRKSVILPLVRDAAPGETLRVWVPGVSTGEEAYTIAMLMIEAMEEQGARVALQVFATDPDEHALSVGRAGAYSAAIAEHVSPERLERFFVADGGEFRVRPHLREVVSFAVHDLCKSPPFSRMHLVSCRNVLIYLRPHAQTHVLAVLHFALRSNGHLWLGSHESVGDNQLFAPISKRWRIYQKVGPSRPLPGRPGGWKPRPHDAEPSPEYSRRRNERNVADLARAAVIRTRVPPTVVVSETEQILFMHGALDVYLRFPEGELRRDLSSYLREDLATRTRAALHRCRRSNETVTAMSRPDGFLGPQTCITASPAPEVGDGAVVLTFEDIEPTAHTAPAAVDLGPHEAMIDQLERELQATREDLRNTVEELESSTEELRAANEESMSMNEELQSANEELEATTEELRSLNDEVTSVNVQLRAKIQELERAHDDLTNFFASTKLATLFLNTELRIKRVTPAAADLLSLVPSDTERYVGDIARELLQRDLVAEARAVLEHLVPRRQELEIAGQTFVRTVLPYLTVSRRVEGVVVTLTDITALTKATRRLSEREARQVVLARLGMAALEESDLDSFMNHAVREVQQVLDVDYCKILELSADERSMLLRAGVGWEAGLVGTASVSAGLESQAGYTVQAAEPVVVHDLAAERRFSGPALLHEHGVTSGVSCVIAEGDQVYGVLGAHTRSRRAFTADDGAFLQDIAAVVSSAIERQRTRMRLAIEAAVAKVLAESQGLDEAAGGIHRALERVLGTTIGELWWPAAGGERLVRRVRTGSDAASLPDRPFRKGEGSIGRVWAHGEAEIIVLADDPAFVRVNEARTIGLASGLAFPISSGGNVLGVLAVFSKARFVRDIQFLRSLEWIGRAMGELVRRLDAEAAIREREQRLREIFENVGVSVWELDFATVRRGLAELRASGVSELVAHFDANPAEVGRLLERLVVSQVNTETLRLFGAASLEELVSALDQVFVPESYPALGKALDAFASGVRSFAVETRLGTLRGEPIEATVAVRMPTTADRASRVLLSIMDTTALGRVRSQLEESRRWFEGMTEATPDVVSVYDVLEDRIVYSNREAEHVLGYTPEELEALGEGVTAKLVHPDDLGGVRDFYLALGFSASTRRSVGGSSLVDEHVYRIRRPHGESRWIHARAVPFRTTDEGRVRQALVISRDITDFKRAEDELREANRQKDEYLAMLGHELRNPLAAVTAATELLKLRGGSEAGLQRIHHVLDRQTTHMAKLLDGLLDVSRIVRGKIELDKQRVNWLSVLEDVVADRSEEIDHRGLELRIDVPPEPLWIEGDRVRLVQIVDNLLSNAINYTNAPGTISLRAERKDGLAVLEVCDTGVGIDPELLPHIFESFRQAGQSLDRSKGGLGLGLALVRGLVDLHDGTVVANSDGSGKGSTFRVCLPTAPGGSEERRLATDGHSSKRILIIEDNEDAADLLMRVLELSGHQVWSAATGAEGVELARRACPEVVLCDLGLPGGMTGYDVARAVRADASLCDLFMIALTGYGRPEDKRRSAEAGFDAHLTKPVDLEQLREILEQGATQVDGFARQ